MSYIDKLLSRFESYIDSHPDPQSPAPQVKTLLEQALTYALDPTGSTGAYPYGSGIRWEIDASQDAGSRFTKVEVNSRLGGTWAVIQDATVYTVVTNSYSAGGKVRDRSRELSWNNHTHSQPHFPRTATPSSKR